MFATIDIQRPAMRGAQKKPKAESEKSGSP